MISKVNNTNKNNMCAKSNITAQRNTNNSKSGNIQNSNISNPIANQPRSAFADASRSIAASIRDLQCNRPNYVGGIYSPNKTASTFTPGNSSNNNNQRLNYAAPPRPTFGSGVYSPY